MTGAVPCHEPEANEARSQPTPHRSNQSDNAAPCGYAALGWSASTWRLQIGLNNLPGTTSTPATQPLSKRPLSKGHAAQALYAVLAERGLLAADVLATYNRDGGRLAEHPGAHGVPGIEAATGALGHGLPLALGMALAARVAGRGYRVFALLSDGECNEGTVWEAAMFAAAQRLESLSVLIDYNGWQATGRSDEVMALRPLAGKWAAFGWSATEVDGHDPTALADRLRRVPDGTGRPVALICHTVKGRGVSFMEDDNNWHYRIPDAGEMAAAIEELAAS